MCSVPLDSGEWNLFCYSSYYRTEIHPKVLHVKLTFCRNFPILQLFLCVYIFELNFLKHFYAISNFHVFTGRSSTANWTDAALIRENVEHSFLLPSCTFFINELSFSLVLSAFSKYFPLFFSHWCWYPQFFFLADDKIGLDGALNTLYCRSQMYLSRQMSRLRPELTMPIFSGLSDPIFVNIFQWWSISSIPLRRNDTSLRVGSKWRANSHPTIVVALARKHGITVKCTIDSIATFLHYVLPRLWHKRTARWQWVDRSNRNDSEQFVLHNSQGEIDFSLY